MLEAKYELLCQQPIIQASPGTSDLIDQVDNFLELSQEDTSGETTREPQTQTTWHETPASNDEIPAINQRLANHELTLLDLQSQLNVIYQILRQPQQNYPHVGYVQIDNPSSNVISSIFEQKIQRKIQNTEHKIDDCEYGLPLTKSSPSDTLGYDTSEQVDELATLLSTTILIHESPVTRSEHETFARAIDCFYSPEDENTLSTARETIRKIASEYYTMKDIDLIHVIPAKNIDVAVQFTNALNFFYGLWVDSEQTRKDELLSMTMPDRLSYIHQHYPRKEIVGYIISLVIIHCNIIILKWLKREKGVHLKPTSEIIQILKEFSLPRLYKLAQLACMPKFFVEFLVSSMCNVYFYLITLEEKTAQSFLDDTQAFADICMVAVKEKGLSLNMYAADELEAKHTLNKMFSILTELQNEPGNESSQSEVQRTTKLLRDDRSENSSFTGEKIPSKRRKD